MSKTLTSISWALVVLGVGLSAWLCPDFIVFFPYIFLALAISDARAVSCRAWVLAVTLVYLLLQFEASWEGKFVHPTTLDAIPDVIGLGGTLIAAFTGIIVRRIERKSLDTKAVS